MSRAAHLPTVDVAPLLTASPGPDELAEAAAAIDRACRDTGFFAVVGHGITPDDRERLERAARAFFALPAEEKSAIAMERAGAAWRGWFPVGGELTSGRPDHKEGIYAGIEHPPDHPRVVTGTPLHGSNLFPAEPADLGPAVLDRLAAMRPVADAVLRAMAVGLGQDADWFERHLTADPTVLFRIFHYPPQPPGDDETWGVGEHTDYGLLTLLAHDGTGGLEIGAADDAWSPIEVEPDVLVCNLGDMLERLTGGRYRSTPHRVRNTAATGRLSFPYFFDPSWDATVPTLPSGERPRPGRERWDAADVTAWDGTYGEYLTAKVARVFPQLFDDVAGGERSSPPGEIFESDA